MIYAVFSDFMILRVANLQLSRGGEGLQVGFGGFGDDFGVAGIDGGEIDEVAADAEGARAGLDEAGRRSRA